MNLKFFPLPLSAPSSLGSEASVAKSKPKANSQSSSAVEQTTQFTDAGGPGGPSAHRSENARNRSFDFFESNVKSSTNSDLEAEPSRVGTTSNGNRKETGATKGGAARGTAGKN